MNPTHITVPAVLLDQTVKFVEVSSMMGKRALDEIEVHRQGQKRAADLKNALLEHMVAVGVVNAQQKQGADAMLSSHAETMQLLKAAVDKIAFLKTELDKQHQKTAGDLGQAVDPQTLEPAYSGGKLPMTKEGEYDSLNDPMVGRQTPFLKKSDLALMGKYKPEQGK